MKQHIALSMNAFIGVVTFAAWAQMAFLTGDGTLSASGLTNLKFFTVLSNLFNGVVAFLYVYWVLRKKPMTQTRTTVKLMANAAVGLTFITVVVFLGPLYGYASMFLGANLWFHLLLPLASWVSFIFFEEQAKLPRKQARCAMIPVALYEVGYILNILINGIGEWPNRNDFYGFLLWGPGVGALFTIGMLLIAWGIALALRWAAGKVRQGE